MRARRLASILLAVSLLIPVAAVAAADGAAVDTFVGADGKVYEAAESDILEGRDGELFWGLSMDLFCRDGGARLRVAFKRLSKLARIIKASGREAVFTTATDKTLVNESNVIRSQLPHGRCTKVGMAEQRRVLDRFADPAYLPIRKALAAEKGQTFWKTDMHWTTIGASVFAQQLATRLDPALGARQRYRPDKRETAVGLLNQFRDVDTPETVPAWRPATGVKATRVAGSDRLDQRFPFDHQWTSKPAKLTYPGRTLLLGDSFTMMGLKSLRPIFRRGRFLWIGNVDTATIAQAIRRSDTVVIEVVQLYVTDGPLGTRAFRNAVRDALR